MKIKKGLYLIVDPAMGKDFIVEKVKSIEHESVVAIQLWDNFKPFQDPLKIIEELLPLCQRFSTPLLVNNRWELLLEAPIDGVHFDKPPEDLNLIKKRINRQISIGITCTNDLSIVEWAESHRLDYISFCSLFPSSTADRCEIVRFDTIQNARKLTDIPLFLAGGITPEKMELLQDLDYWGIAVVSGIMLAQNPREELRKFYQEFKK